MTLADERCAVVVEGHAIGVGGHETQGDCVSAAGIVSVKPEVQENGQTQEIIEGLLGVAPAGSSAWRALKFSALCLQRGGLPTDVERLFLLEDLKGAGLPAAQLRAVQAAMRGDNDAAGRRLRNGAPSSAGAAVNGGCLGGVAAGVSNCDGSAALLATQASHREGTATLRAARALLVKWGGPEDELDGIACYVQDAVRRGGEELPPSRVCVAVPDARWGRLVQRALEHRCFDVSRTQLGYALAEDPRDAGRAQATAAINALDLLACPEDPLAWRVRCGLGMPDLGTRAWGGLLEAWNGESAFDTASLLASACAAQTASSLSTCYEKARAFLSEKHSLRGYSLAHAVGADEVPALAGLIGQLEGDEGAAMLAGKARRCLCGPVFDCSRPTVHVVTYEAVADRGYGLVVVLAAAEGLADGADEQGNPAILRAAGLPCDSLVISYFAGASVAAARKAHIPVGRTRLVDGIEIAHVRPAAALARLGAALPPTQSGQAFLEV